MSKWQNDDNESRRYFCHKGFGALLDSFGFGRGLGASTEVVDGGAYHSFGIEILAELGIWTFLALCVLFLWFCAILFRAIQMRRDPYWNSALLATCFAFPILQFGPSSIMGEGIFWLWFGVLTAHAGLTAATVARTTYNSSGIET